MVQTTTISSTKRNSTPCFPRLEYCRIQSSLAFQLNPSISRMTHTTRYRSIVEFFFSSCLMTSRIWQFGNQLVRHPFVSNRTNLGISFDLILFATVNALPRFVIPAAAAGGRDVIPSPTPTMRSSSGVNARAGESSTRRAR